MKIYFVEDEQMNWIMARDEFKKEHQITRVSSLDEAVEQLQNAPFDLYIVDGMFPKRKFEKVEYLAPDLIRTIQKSQNDARIILASSNEKYSADAKNLGVGFKSKLDPDYFDWINQL